MRKMEMWGVLEEVYDRNRDSMNGVLDHKDAMICSLLAALEAICLDHSDVLWKSDEPYVAES